MAKKDKDGGGGHWLNKTSDSLTVPDGAYNIKIKKLEITETKEAHKRMWVVTHETTAPKEWAGRLLRDFFVLGTDDDPDGRSKAARNSRSAVKLRRMLLKGNVELAGDDEDICAAATGAELMAVVTERESKSAGYEGNLENNIGDNGYYSLGEKDPEVTGDAPKAKPKLKAVAAAKPAKAAVVEEDDEDDEDEEEEKPAVKTAKKAAVAKAPVAAKEEEEEDDEDDEDEDEEDDEDEDDEEDEAPKGRRRA